jgi:hypothetical protein
MAGNPAFRPFDSSPDLWVETREVSGFIRGAKTIGGDNFDRRLMNAVDFVH